jgi:hypothetical protein
MSVTLLEFLIAAVRTQTLFKKAKYLEEIEQNRLHTPKRSAHYFSISHIVLNTFWIDTLSSLEEIFRCTLTRKGKERRHQSKELNRTENIAPTQNRD